ncbi:hypothetical protein M9458_055907 [Cirrhinus mrigala]|uniref:CCHC-type domain-containing protein n=1 Tax=Cirrhinus mrigala TaxID=683832 RepID=A0ABD0MG00_CIRMR
MSTESPAATNPFSELVNALKAAFQEPSTPPSVSGSPMAMPATFAGEAVECSGFLLQVNLFIKMQPQLGISHLTPNRYLECRQSDHSFLRTVYYSFHRSFQYNYRRTRYIGSTLPATAGHFFGESLHASLPKHCSGPTDKASIPISELLWRQHWIRGLSATNNQSRPKPSRLPATYYRSSACLGGCLSSSTMQIDSTRLIMNGLCLYCGQSGHHLRQCSIRPPRPLVSTLSTEVEISSLTLLPVTLHTSNISLCFCADCLNQLQLARRPHHQVLSVKTIQGKPLGRGKIRHSSPIITLQVGLFHYEDIKFLVLEDSTASIILGRPWLQQHHPELSWDPDYCNQHCLIKVPRPSADPLILSSTRIESPDQAFIPEVPAEYMAFQDVFSKQAATQLPPHRPWDCAIDLLPGAQLPKGAPGDGGIHLRGPSSRIHPAIDLTGRFQLLLCGQEGWGGYGPALITVNSTPKSFNNPIRSLWSQPPSKSFVEPKSSRSWTSGPVPLPNVYERGVPGVPPSVRDCLHRRHLDLLPEHGRTSPPRPAGPPQTQRTRLYLKLEKCEFHRPSVHFLGYISAEGVQMDQGKISVIQEWPQPLTVKELQRFLGFANFYRRFIKDYSTITAPLTSLLRGKPKTISWNPPAHEAFLHLKKIFSTTPLLHHPDPELPFTVEVDASTTGAGAVLSQAVGEPPLLHPCAFSRKLSPAEENYNVGNRELLAIKLALEEWRHWLEGSKHPFTIITDHKNLQYIREAKRLNPRQAR